MRKSALTGLTGPTVLTVALVAVALTVGLLPANRTPGSAAPTANTANAAVTANTAVTAAGEQRADDVVDGGSAGLAAAARPQLLQKFEAASDCTVYANYPNEGVIANDGFTVPKGEAITWRYNVNSTWSVVQSPARANKVFPWWGFTRTSCIGKSIVDGQFPAGQSVPKRLLEGRSQQAGGWRTVVFRIPEATVLHRHQRVYHGGTLRDPANFVIGNAKEGWHVDVTGNTRSSGHWVQVYVPNGKRWGWIEAAKLRP